MKYSFPTITHINEVIEAIKDKPEFIVADRGTYSVVNYMVAKPDTFPIENPILRECRGLIFDSAGFLISRPYHKFFNVNERDETQISNLSLDEPHIILEKLDGSLIRPVPDDNGGFFLATKMGKTDIADMAMELINSDYRDFINLHLERGQTPLFEFCSRKNRVIVDHPVDRLVLTAIRSINDGTYIPYDQMLTYAESYNIDCVKSYPGTVESMQTLVDNIRGEEEGEGWVVRFADGHMIKIKNELYIRMHKAKDGFIFERNVVKSILNSEIDDFKSLMHINDRKILDVYEMNFWLDLNSFNDSLIKKFLRAKKQYTRKEFAIAKPYDRLIMSLILNAWDTTGSGLTKSIRELFLKKTSSNAQFSEVKYLLKSATWNNFMPTK